MFLKNKTVSSDEHKKESVKSDIKIIIITIIENGVSTNAGNEL